ncbi:MAG TPA: UvrD-helicase domain-containing protein [Bacteroidales bacterium]|nr:UvrD-helicase domain-containing protein [Bacteroidales bacterium]HSA43208.1 UvrD-helicase domain-containing protein [Bacteroidales bacterium]
MAFILYRSSAGSGKTFTLVGEYLKIVLRKPDAFRHILAITFTNKAAQEMKDRILLYLNELSKPDRLQSSSFLLDKLVRETGLSPQLIIQRAAEVQKLILHHYSDFAVTTIDSFMHRVIRTFAFDLHVPVDFSVEMDAEMLISQAVSNLIKKAGINKELTDALIKFALYKSELDKGWNIDRDLEVTGSHLFKENSQVVLDESGRERIDLKVFTTAFQRIRQLTQAFESEVRRLAREADALIEGCGADRSAFFQGSRGIVSYFHRLSNGNMEAMIPSNYVLQTIEQDKWYAGKSRPIDQQCIAAIKDDLLRIYLQINEIISEGSQQYLSLKLVEKGLLPVAMLNEIDAELQVIKSENRILPIGEFNKKITDSILNEPVPFIFERLGEWYQHYLIDEFQDTSVLQWINLLPLVENALSNGNDCTLVGDGKQAVYRFRNGDVEQFANLPEVRFPSRRDIPEGRKLILARHFKEFNLDTNYRTASVIVSFNNAFFSFIAGRFGDFIRLLYKDVVQKTLSSKPGGYVSLEFLGKSESLSIKDLHIERTREIIQACFNDGYHARDIAVLCRSNIEASLVSRDLTEHGISVSSAESLLLKNAPSVNTIIACLKLLYLSTDALSSEVLRVSSVLYGFNTLAFLDSVDTYEDLTVYETVEKLVRDLGFDEKPDPFVLFFLDFTYQYTQNEEATLGGFLDWWAHERNKASLITPGELDSVKVMTIHKAKGLEFNVVVYPFAKMKVKSPREASLVPFSSQQIPELKLAFINISKQNVSGSIFEPLAEKESDKLILDLLNILYVVMTRPKERLYIISEKSGELKDNTAVSVPELFARFLISQGFDAGGQGPFEWGTPEKKQLVKGQDSGQHFLERAESRDWRARVAIRFRHPSDWDVLLPDRRRLTGTHIHQLLSGIRSVAELKHMVTERKPDPGLTEEQQDEFFEAVRKLIALTGIEQVFPESGRVRNEAGILTPEGRLYIPDRVVMSDDETIVTDYKTGKPFPSHQQQLMRYAELLKQMDYPGVKAFLLYFYPEPELQRVV